MCQVVCQFARESNVLLFVNLNSDARKSSEVSRKVDELTALTKATLKRVEKLTSGSNIDVNQRTVTSEIEKSGSTSANSSSSLIVDAEHSTVSNVLPGSPSKYSILKKFPSEDCPLDVSMPRQHHHNPVSILKHKTNDNTAKQSSANSFHVQLPVTFSPSVIETDSKRHGILKKRSSLDESEILRRRSCSPDISLVESSSSDFRPILKTQRRSSLDEIVRRPQSPEAHPTSILKRKSSKEDDWDYRQLGSPEPQGILKRKSSNNGKGNAASHRHVLLSTINVKTAPSGAEQYGESEVRPILKKKQSREEAYLQDFTPPDPRPILKKKSSTESDEHDERPKKTILKCSRKSSYDDSGDADSTSPRKLSLLRNRLVQCRSVGSSDSDSVRSILKQTSRRNSNSEGNCRRLNFCDCVDLDDTAAIDDDSTPDQFQRKRAQSVGHVQATASTSEFSFLLNKKRTAESTSLNDITYHHKFQAESDPVQCNETSSTSYKEPNRYLICINIIKAKQNFTLDFSLYF